MDSLKIRAFLLVAKYKNFSLAAKELSYTPSALSHIADSIEEELGVKLFNRTRKGVEITADGKKLYNNFLKISDDIDELYKVSANIRKKKESELKIGAFSSIALHILPEILYGFKQLYPNVKITILVDDNMQDWIKNNVADIVLADDLLNYEFFYPLFKEEYVAIAREKDFKNSFKIEAIKLYKFPYIRLKEEFLDDYFDYSKFPEVIPVNSMENDSVLYMVKEGLGVTVVPKMSARNCPKGVKILGLTPSIERTIGIAYNKNSASLMCERFVQYTRKQFANR